MKKGLTELIFILDRSGSMQGLEADTIGGFNSLLAAQREKEGEVLVSTVLFDEYSEVIHDRVPLACVRPLSKREYFVRGSTALLDAIGSAIRHIGNVHKYARSEDVPEHTMFVITTDGMENASRTYSAERVRELISRQKERYGWEFLFLGANIDAVETAANFGIDRAHSVTYRADSLGTKLNYQAMESAISMHRRGEAIDESWKADIEADMEARAEKDDARKEQTGADSLSIHEKWAQGGITIYPPKPKKNKKKKD